MKQLADANRTEREFKVGEFVYLKLHPFGQNSLRSSKQNKLSPKYFGPFMIVERIGKVAYRLDLPDDCAVHPTFHVSLLKLAKGSHSTVIPLPSQPRFMFYPEAVVERRIMKKRNRMGMQVLIRWKNLQLTEASWEDLEEMELRFPNFDFGILRQNS
ncbi:putative chromatin remodeling & transcriptional activation CHROMO-DOMAIN family [Helianthus annuus]|nr:putative chromatin remodeling & transcriptional activation CHROMO-DOMAIN family [Helianthus annuus]